MAAMSLSLLITISVAILSLSGASSSGDVHDLLSEYGLPRGLIPSNDKSFSFSNDDGAFSVELESPCYVMFVDLVYYEKKITGKLSNGKLSEISGIRVKKLFVWLDMVSVEVAADRNALEIQIGVLAEELPYSLFDKVQKCRTKLSDSA